MRIQLQYLDWDSEQLGIRCGLIDGTRPGDVFESSILCDDIRELIEKHPDIDFITIKLDRNCVKSVNALIQMGVALIDTELTFIYSHGTKKALEKEPASCRVVFCKQTDRAGSPHRCV